MSPSGGQAPVLILEDNDEDYLVIEQVFSEHGLANNLLRFTDGDQCLDHLAAHRQHTQRPTLLLVDLNTPGTDGREVLTEIKADPLLRAIPVIIVSSSSSPRDIEFCYANGANSFQVKPMDVVEFDHKLRALVEYWLETAVLPTSIAYRA